MPRTLAGSTLYRLIAAGRRAHAAVQAPLRERGLMAGDDVVVLLLAEGPLALDALSAAASVPQEVLAPLVSRLVLRRYVEVAADGRTFALTGAGRTLHDALADAWLMEEARLTGGLSRRRRKALRKVLRRYADGPEG